MSGADLTTAENQHLLLECPVIKKHGHPGFNGDWLEHMETLGDGRWVHDMFFFGNEYDEYDTSIENMGEYGLYNDNYDKYMQVLEAKIIFQQKSLLFSTETLFFPEEYFS